MLAHVLWIPVVSIRAVLDLKATLKKVEKAAPDASDAISLVQNSKIKNIFEYFESCCCCSLQGNNLQRLGTRLLTESLGHRLPRLPRLPIFEGFQASDQKSTT